jgi:hypothetical protein
MSNTNTSNNDDDDTFIAVPNVHVPVTMYGNGFSTISIGTDSLGPCVCFAIDLIFKGTPHCILEHYSYNELDESGMSMQDILLFCLYHILGLIKGKLGLKSIFDDNNQPCTDEIYLLVSEDDILEGTYIRNAFLILNIDQFQIIDENYGDKELLYLYHQSKKNNVIVLKPVTKILKNKKKNKGNEGNKG